MTPSGPWPVLLDKALKITRDVEKSAPAGLVQGLVGLAGTPGDVRKLSADLAVTGAAKIGLIDPTQAAKWREDAERARRSSDGWIPAMKTSAEIARSLPSSAREMATYQPSTVPGRYVRTAAEFLPNAITPGGAPLKAAAVAIPAFASETAGLVTKGTRFEGAARFVGGMVGVGGIRAAAAPTKGRVFWSNGMTDAPARQSAELWAEQNGGRTLEQTLPGKALSATNTALLKGLKTIPALRKIPPGQRRDLATAWRDAAMKPLWDTASSSFAQGAKGPVEAFLGPRLRPEATWTNVEHPMLRRGGNAVNYHPVN